MEASSQSAHWRSQGSVSVDKGDLELNLIDPDFQIFYHAHVLILISADAPGPWIVEDCALAAGFDNVESQLRSMLHEVDRWKPTSLGADYPAA